MSKRDHATRSTCLKKVKVFVVITTIIPNSFELTCEVLVLSSPVTFSKKLSDFLLRMIRGSAPTGVFCSSFVNSISCMNTDGISVLRRKLLTATFTCF